MRNFLALCICSLLLSACGAGGTESSNSTSVNFESLKPKWVNACSQDPVSEKCASFASNPELVQNFWRELGRESGDLPLSVDFSAYSPEFLGNMFCHKSSEICSADLEITNLQDFGWDGTLIFELLGPNNEKFSSSSKMIFSNPLNPGVTRQFNVEFEVGSNMQGFKVIHVMSNNSGELWSIPICAPFKDEPDEYGNVHYENYLRLSGCVFSF